jgi:hypothetical protein
MAIDIESTPDSLDKILALAAYKGHRYAHRTMGNELIAFTLGINTRFSEA